MNVDTEKRDILEKIHIGGRHVGISTSLNEMNDNYECVGSSYYEIDNDVFVASHIKHSGMIYSYIYYIKDHQVVDPEKHDNVYTSNRRNG